MIKFFVFFRDEKWRFVYLLFLAQLNLFFMHYYVSMKDCLEWRYMYSYPVSICASFFDVFAFFFIFLLISQKNSKVAALLTYFFTLLWSFVNVYYVRFFHQYISLSAFGEVERLQNELVLGSIMSEIQLSDLYFLLSFIIFVFLYYKTKARTMNTSALIHLFIIPFIFIILAQTIYSIYHFMGRSRFNWELYLNRSKELMGNVVVCGTPNLAHFHAGCLRTIIFDVNEMISVTGLTNEERQEIAFFCNNSYVRTTHHQRPSQIKNVIMILLESFLSSSIDLVIDNKEITPFLNSLKRDSTIFYSGRMLSDIAGGESSDGQFIYLTGLLPLQHKVTVSIAKKRELPSLPKILSEKMGIKNLEIYVPTLPNMWQQADMNKVYGFNKMYSQGDIIPKSKSSISDKDMFEFASKKIEPSNEPFFSLILSLSTHAPYDTYEGDNYLEGNKSLPLEYRNYLNTCHYTDIHLNSFINSLKASGLYDHSLIIICADHHAHVDRMGMAGKITTHTPLFIINGCVDSNSIWKGDFHQLDTYTTLLDILGLDDYFWKGLGKTILSPDYYNSVDINTYKISRMIIEGDYFNIRKKDK